MYKVIYWTTRGAEITKDFESIDNAACFAFQVRYRLKGVFDKNGDCIFNKVENLGNGVYIFSRIYKPV